jgi:hypothetical protein
MSMINSLSRWLKHATNHRADAASRSLHVRKFNFRYLKSGSTPTSVVVGFHTYPSVLVHNILASVLVGEDNLGSRRSKPWAGFGKGRFISVSQP